MWSVGIVARKFFFQLSVAFLVVGLDIVHRDSSTMDLEEGSLGAILKITE